MNDQKRLETKGLAEREGFCAALILQGVVLAFENLAVFWGEVKLKTVAGPVAATIASLPQKLPRITMIFT